MKKVCLLVAAVAAMVLAACDLPTAPSGESPRDLTNAQPGEAFDLSLGSAAHIEEANLDIAFIDVTEDSRCPTNAECIQAGRAVMVFEVTPGEGDMKTVTITLAAETSEPVEVGGYTLTVTALNPYPGVGDQPAKDDYIATLLVAAAG